MAEFGTTKPTPKPTSRRRRGAFALVFLVMAMIAGLVVVAVQADGRELSRTTANDGGAWVVNRQLGAVAHKNRATGELSSYVLMPDNPNLTAYQAQGIVVAHDPTTNLVFEIDPRSSSEDLVPTQIPDGAKIIAIDHGLIVYRTEPSLAVWQISADELTGLTSLDGLQPVVAADGPGLVAAHAMGSLAAVDAETGLLNWLTADEVKLEAFDMELAGTVIDVSLVGASVVVLTDAGELVSVGPTGVEHRASWDAVVAGAGEPALLQRPSVDLNPVEIAAADSVVVISEIGELVEVVFGDEAPQAVVRGTLAGAQPLAPIVHDGCVYAVVVSPPTYGSVCDEFSTQNIDAASSEITLRLVNGWIWVNDLESGQIFSPDETQILEELDDWGLVIDAVADDESQEEPEGGELPAADDVEIIDDPDAEGEIREDDEFDATELNLPPIAVDDEAQTRVDQITVVEVLENDIDPNNDVLAVVAVELLAGEGRVDITPAGTATQVNPAAGFSGVIEYRYTITDGRSGPVSALVSVVVVPDENNQAPIAETDVVPTTPGEPQTINVLANDSDPDGDAIILQSITTETGNLRWDPSGLVTFTADGDTEAGWIELPYVVADSSGATGQGRVRIEIRDSNANQEPDARNDQMTTVVGRPVSTNLLDNDVDPDGDPLILGSEPKLIEPEGAPTRTDWTPDGEFVFAADTPGTYIFTYTINDAAPDGSESDTARIRVDVLPGETNSPPIAVRDDVVVPVGETRSVRVLENDGDPDGDVIAIVDWSVGPGVFVSELLDDTGQIGFEITLTEQAGAAPEMTYFISDGVNNPVSAPVVIAVAARTVTNQPPLAKDDALEARPGQTIVVPVLENDSDPEGDPLTIVSVGSTALASVTILPDGTALLLDMPLDAESSFSVPYDIEDSAGNRASATLWVQWIGSVENRPPEARVDEQRTQIDTAVVITVLKNDDDPDGDRVSLSGVVEQPRFGSARPNADGSITYTPIPSFTGSDSFRYIITDPAGFTDIGDVFVGVMEQAAQNQPPIAADDAAQVTSANPTPIRVLSNDLDPDGDQIRIIDVSAATLGTVSVDGRIVVYTPPASNPEAATDTFEYTIADSGNKTDTATVTIDLGVYADPAELPEDELEPESADEVEVEPTPEPEEPTPEPTPTPGEENLAPVAVDDNPPAAEPGSLISVAVLANDFDPDGDQQDLVIQSVGDGGTIDGEFILATVGDEVTEIVYTIVDPDGAEASAIITVRPPTNGLPVAVDDNPPAAKTGTQITVAVLENDSDPDGGTDELTIVSVGDGAVIDGDVVIVTVGEQAAEIPYTIVDRRGAEASAIINVSVLENGIPIARDDDPPPAKSGTELSVPVLANDIDPDGEIEDLTIVSVGEGAVINGDLVIVTVGDDDTAVSYTIVDPDGGEATAFINIIVVPNSTPVLTPLDVATDFETPITLNIGDLVTDADDDGVFFVCCEDERGGTAEVVVAAENELIVTFTPESDFVGVAGFSYTADDQNGNRPTDTVTIRVAAPGNRAPETFDDSVEVQQRGVELVDLARLATDPDDDDLTYSIVTAPGPGASVQIVGATAELSVEDGVAADTRGFFTFEVSDGILSTEGRIDYTVVEGENRPPLVSSTTLELQAATGEIVDLETLTDERDLGDSVTWSLDGSAVPGLTVEITGSLVTVTAAADAAGRTGDVGFIAADTRGGEATGVIAVSVVETTLAPPRAEDDKGWRIGPEEILEIPVLANDIDPLTEGLTVLSIGEPTIGAATVQRIAGQPDTVLFSTAAGETGSAVFTYTVADSAGRESTATITVQVVSAPDQLAPPRAVAASREVTISWDTPLLNGADLQGYRITRNDGVFENIPVQNSYTWGGLENDVEYTFTVTALSDLGESLESAPSPTVTPDQKPEAPTIQSVTSQDGKLLIRWAPATSLGSEVDDYEIRIGGDLVGVVEPPYTHLTGGLVEWLWEPLPNGNFYTFEVRSHNNAGWSENWSVSSQPVAPAGVPDPPIIGTTVRGSESGALEVNWSKPADDNGARIIEYWVRVYPDGVPQKVQGEDTLTVDWANLQDGVEVAFQVQAHNSAGESVWSEPSNYVKPCGVPAVPVITSAVRGDKFATITWDEPDLKGCTDVTYHVQAVGTADEFSTSDLGRDYPGLVNGERYTFTVQAENEQGRSAQSVPSVEVIPAGKPIFCPTSGVVSVAPTAKGEILVSWDGAFLNGDIGAGGFLRYQVQIDGGAWQDANPTSVGASNHRAIGLADNSTYSFLVRAENSVGYSETNCGAVSARTWALPDPMTMTVEYTPANQAINWYMLGGESPDTPVTSATHTLTKDGGVLQGPFVLPESGPNWYNTVIATEDGAYSGTTQICNAVGCVDGVGNTVNVVVPKPPDLPTVEEVILTNGQARHETLGNWSGGVFSGHFLGAQMQIKIGRKWPIPDNDPTEYDYELDRRNGPGAPWVEVDANTVDFTATETFPWSIIGTFDPLYGYSDHPNGMNNGQQWEWRFRVKARNDAGETDWTPWEVTNVDQWSATFRMEVVEASNNNCPLLNGNGPTQCHYLVPNVYGYPANNVYIFDSPACCNGNGVSHNSGVWWAASCNHGQVTLDGNGRGLPEGGPLTSPTGTPYAVRCISPAGSEIAVYVSSAGGTVGGYWPAATD